jgi:hypothetical protein
MTADHGADGDGGLGCDGAGEDDEPQWNCELTLFGPWRALELDPARCGAVHGALAREVIGRSDDDRTTLRRADLVRRLRGIAASALVQGAFAAAARLEGGSLQATVTVLDVRCGPELVDPRDIEATLDRLEPLLVEARDGDVGDPFVEGVIGRAGPMLRVQTLTRLPDDAGGPDLLVETVQYWLPVPATRDLALLSFAAPDLARAQELLAEFDQLAGSLTIEWACPTPPMSLPVQ